MDGRRNGNKGWKHCDVHGTNYRGEWGCKKCEITKARSERDAYKALAAACVEWRDFMFHRMPRETAMKRAENPGTPKIVAALDALSL